MTLKLRGRKTLGMQTELLTAMLTDHAQQIAHIKPNERLEVINVDVEGETSRVLVDHMYEEAN